MFYIPVKNCCRTTISNCGDLNYNEFVVYQPFYTEHCGLYTYTTGQSYLSYEQMREGMIVNSPANLTNGQTATVTYTNNNSYHYFYNSNPTKDGYIEYVWEMQSNISLIGANPIYLLMPNGTIRYPIYYNNTAGIVTVRFDSIYDKYASYTHDLKMNIVGFCGGGAPSQTTLKTYWVRDPRLWNWMQGIIIM